MNGTNDGWYGISEAVYHDIPQSIQVQLYVCVAPMVLALGNSIYSSFVLINAKTKWLHDSNAAKRHDRFHSRGLDSSETTHLATSHLSPVHAVLFLHDVGHDTADEPQAIPETHQSTVQEEQKHRDHVHFV